ncbi:hypothetical protein ES707_22927 [subsurface metagenome]
MPTLFLIAMSISSGEAMPFIKREKTAELIACWILLTTKAFVNFFKIKGFLPIFSNNLNEMSITSEEVLRPATISTKGIIYGG